MATPFIFVVIQVERKTVMIDMIATTSSKAPYVETDKKAMECSFRSLEFVNAMYVGERAKIPVLKLSEVTHA